MSRLSNFWKRLQWQVQTKFLEILSGYISNFINGHLKQKYFFIVIIIGCSVGIWLPILLESLAEKDVQIHNISSNVITYFVSILFASMLDNFLSKTKTLDTSQIVMLFINLVLVGFWGIFLASISIILYLLELDSISLVVSCMGVLTAWIMWWSANERNSNLESNVFSPVGGKTSDRTLIDG